MKLLHRLGFNAADQAACLEDISRLLGAGMPLRQMFSFLANSGRNAQVRALAQGSLANVAAGRPFASTWHRWFPDDIVNQIILAEESGSVRAAFERIIGQYQSGESFLDIVVKPNLRWVAIFTLLLAISSFVEQNAELFLGRLAAPGQSLAITLSIGSAVNRWGPMLGTLLTISLPLAGWWFFQSTGAARLAVAHWPAFSLFTHRAAIRIIGQLRDLYAAGADTPTALRSLRPVVTNAWARLTLDRIATAVAAGIAPAEALARHLLPLQFKTFPSIAAEINPGDPGSQARDLHAMLAAAYGTRLQAARRLLTSLCFALAMPLLLVTGIAILTISSNYGAQP